MKDLVAISLTPRMMQFLAVVFVPLAQATHFSSYETKVSNFFFLLLAEFSILTLHRTGGYGD